MKQGRYFRIPEGPADVERLWAEAAPARGQMPAWLAPAGPDAYRRIAKAAPPEGDERERTIYFEELERLEAASLVIDDVWGDRPEHAIYVPAPCRDEPWAIGIYQGSSPLHVETFDAARNPVLTRDCVTDAPASFVADPFMIRVSDRWYMFFEVMNWRTNKGEIGLATSDDGVCWRYECLVLVEPFHLSYPFVFEWRGAIYMMPESGQANAVRLYRARRFPFEWELAEELLSGSCFLDSSLLHYDGRWWLFSAPTADNDTLALYYAENPLGPWRQHPASPVVRGNRRLARPAGRPVVHEGAIIRFTQDCEDDYGSAVRAVRITNLTTASYREETVGEVVIAGGSAGWAGGGMHHIDAHRLGRGRWTACVDGRPRGEDAGEHPCAVGRQ